MPGSTPATSQLDWLISTTAMIVLSWSNATRDLIKACPGAGRGRSAGASGHSVSYLPATMVPSPSPPAPYHLSLLVEAVTSGTRLGNDNFRAVGVRMGVERPVNYRLKRKGRLDHVRAQNLIGFQPFGRRSLHRWDEFLESIERRPPFSFKQLKLFTSFLCSMRILKL